ncbi:hypothetical protein ABIB87_004640 [Bradyrhizobium sp. JR18.2]
MSGQTITKTIVDGLEKQASEYTVWGEDEGRRCMRERSRA